MTSSINYLWFTGANEMGNTDSKQEVIKALKVKKDLNQASDLLDIELNSLNKARDLVQKKISDRLGQEEFDPDIESEWNELQNEVAMTQPGSLGQEEFDGDLESELNELQKDVDSRRYRRSNGFANAEEFDTEIELAEMESSLADQELEDLTIDEIEKSHQLASESDHDFNSRLEKLANDEALNQISDADLESEWNELQNEVGSIKQEMMESPEEVKAKEVLEGAQTELASIQGKAGISVDAPVQSTADSKPKTTWLQKINSFFFGKKAEQTPVVGAAVSAMPVVHLPAPPKPAAQAQLPAQSIFKGNQKLQDEVDRIKNTLNVLNEARASSLLNPNSRRITPQIVQPVEKRVQGGCLHCDTAEAL